MSQARIDENQSRYRSSWYLEKDASKIKLECVAVVDHGRRESTLWKGSLPDGTPVLIFSKAQPKGKVAHERSFMCEDEARSFFARQTGLLL